MGLLDFIFGKNDDASSAGGSAAAAPAGFAARLGQTHSMSPDQVQALYIEWLNTIGAQLGEGQARYNSNDREGEWRGTCQGLPMRIKADTFPGVEGALKWQNPHGTVTLNWDPEYVQQPGDNDAWDESDSVRVFVGKGVVIETFQWGMDSELAGFKALPSGPMEHLIAAMPRDGVSRLYIRDDEIEWGFKEHADDMHDPVMQIATFSKLVAWAAASWAATPVDPHARALVQQAEDHGGTPIAALQRMTCGYCGAAFMLDAKGRCPNCGAPAQQ